MPQPRRTAAAFAVLTLALGLPAAAQQVVPTPESVLGFRPGDDFKLATYEESIEYFKRLDAASDHVQLMDVGRTSEGRSWYLAVISSPANLANLERHRESARRLAYASGLTDDDARRLAAETPAFVGSQGPGEMTILLGPSLSISATVMASFLYTRTSSPSSRKYWTRL